jgi:hypothetical protein
MLDCEGRSLGDQNGKLGLIQIGVETTTYLVDVILLPSAISSLKTYLENPRLTKYVWDARSDYSELLHGHGITIKGLVDLQLLYVHTTGLFPRGEIIYLTSMSNAAAKLSVTTPQIMNQIRAGTPTTPRLRLTQKDKRI